MELSGYTLEELREQHKAARAAEIRAAETAVSWCQRDLDITDPLYLQLTAEGAAMGRYGDQLYAEIRRREDADDAAKRARWDELAATAARGLEASQDAAAMLAGTLTDVPMVCTACRGPVIRIAGSWAHENRGASCPNCGLITAMVASGNERVPLAPQWALHV